MNIKMKKLSKILIALLLTTTLSSAAMADTWCGPTKVSRMFVWSDGTVNVFLSIRGDYVAFCNMNSSWKGISPTTCATWLALIKSAVARKADMTIFYNESFTCQAIPSYASAPSPYYVMLEN
jgi:hypothetical protein